MNIGLVDVDSHAIRKQFGSTIYPNLALCKIAAYYKAKGDWVNKKQLFCTLEFKDFEPRRGFKCEQYFE